MIEQVQCSNDQIDLEDGLILVYQEPKEFIRYYSIYITFLEGPRLQ
jgi:hypothetical protein